MVRDGFLIGEVAATSGVSQKALRLYETTGILPLEQRAKSQAEAVVVNPRR